MLSDNKSPETGICLHLVTPAGVYREVLCTSAILTASDGKDGKNGGKIGIRHGHLPAYISLAEGDVSAYENEKEIFRAKVLPGFASVNHNVVTVITDGVSEEK